MTKNELTIRVLATIQTDLAMKRMTLNDVRGSQYNDNLDNFDHTLDMSLAQATADLDGAVSELSKIIDRLNELPKEQ